MSSSVPGHHVVFRHPVFMSLLGCHSIANLVLLSWRFGVHWSSVCSLTVHWGLPEIILMMCLGSGLCGERCLGLSFSAHVSGSVLSAWLSLLMSLWPLGWSVFLRFVYCGVFLPFCLWSLEGSHGNRFQEVGITLLLWEGAASMEGNWISPA